jgi:hypothetical protein
MGRNKKRRNRSTNRPAAASNELTFAFFDRHAAIPAVAANAPAMRASEVVHMAECLAIGMCDRQFRWNLSPFKPVGFQGPAEYWRFWENLGSILEVSKGPLKGYFRLPSTEDVIKLLETRRSQWLHSLRALFSDPEQFVSAFIGGEYFAADFQKRIYPAHLFACNHMLIYTRTRYDIFPNPSVGWKRGRAAEINTVRLQVPEMSAWCDESREFIGRFAFELDDFGGFVVPGEGAPTGPRQKRAVPRVAAYAPERVLFSMSLPTYREMRALSGRNRYGYMAIVYSPDPSSGLARVGLDTVEVGHRFLGFTGPFDQILNIAQTGTMEELRQHPMCKADPRHDPKGAWKTVIREWLGC